MAPQFYNAFSKLNGCNPKQLWCSWRCDKAWREELRKKMSSTEIQADIYKRLKYICEITDCSLFQEYFGNLMKSLKLSPITQTFGQYLSVHWEPKKEHWAYCYRLGTGINTNMRLEAFHRIFKYDYLHGKQNRCVAVCLFTLMKFNRDKIYQRLIKETKRKNTYNKNLIHDKHLSSLGLSINDVKEVDSKIWSVPSASSKSKNYCVSLLSDKCNQTSCCLKCTECGACSHIYKCTCMDFLTKNVPCKHIHLVCSKVDIKLSNDLFVDDAQSSDIMAPNAESVEVAETVNFLRGTEPAEFDKLKGKVLQNLNEMIASVTNANMFNEDAMKNLDRQICAAKNTFSTLCANQPLEFA